MPPLETDNDGAKTYSDHLIQYCCSRLPKKTPPVWESFSFRPFNEKGAGEFESELAGVDWQELYQLQGSNAMAVRLQSVLDDLMDSHFPLKTVKRKETDLPWFNGVARKMTKKQAIYKPEGKSERWVKQCEKVESYLAQRQKIFLKNQRDKLLGPDAASNFFRYVKAFKSVDKPQDFNIKGLRPNNSEEEIASEAAGFFNRISSEFQALDAGDVPSTYHREFPLLSPAQVQKMLKDTKKTKSMVTGDIFPKLVERCAAYLAWPLSAIFNQIIRTYVWPLHWKKEFITLIPKKSSPDDFCDLRNISCTIFFSKVFERYVLQCLEEEISLKPNQYGGVKGCSTTHMVIDILQEICENAEDYRSATVLCAIDFAKAFNRMSFQHCLEALRKKNASTPVIRLIATFLTNRTMTVKVGKPWSNPLPVNGGSPQGSRLGIILFNVTTDTLENDFELFESRRLGIITLPDPEDVSPVRDPGRRGMVALSSPSGNTPPITSPQLSPVLRLPTEGESTRPKVALRPLPQPVLVLPPLEEKTGTQVLTLKAVKIFKYVDDNVSVEKLNSGCVAATDLNGEMVKIKQSGSP